MIHLQWLFAGIFSLRLSVFVFLGVVPDVNIVPVNISYEKVKTKNSDVGTCLAFLLNDLINLRRNTLRPMRS